MASVASRDPRPAVFHDVDAPAASHDAFAPSAPPDMEVATAAAPHAQMPPAAAHLAAADAALKLDTPMDDPHDALPALAAPIAFPPPLHGFGDLLPMDVDFPPPNEERLTAFARLRFDDGSYYMHTYQIILGRDITLAHKDMKRLVRVDQLKADGQPQAAEELLHGRKRKRARRGARSVISEKGGIVSAPIDAMPKAYQQRRQSNASQSLSSASHPTADSGEEKPPDSAPQDLIMQAFPEVPAQFDGHVPEDPNDCPLVPIHPQNITSKTGKAGPKGISREHARIFYDFDEGQFCIEVLGSNGLHHEGDFYPQGEVLPLDHGDHLTIGAVNMQFYLPDVALTEEQRHRQESGSRPMSFSFENGHGELQSEEQMSSESEGGLSINPRHMYHVPIDSDMESEDADDDDDDDMDEYEEPAPRARPKQSLKIKLKTSLPPPPLKVAKKPLKRKYREPTPEEPPAKKVKQKFKPTFKPKFQTAGRDPVRESKTSKEPKVSRELKESKETKDLEKSKEAKELKEIKEPKEKSKASTKAPAKAPSKTPVPDEVAVEESVTAIPTIEVPVKEKVEATKSVPTDSPPLLRKPFEGEIEAGGEIEGLITEEMARQHNLPSSLIGHVVEKRKGPGRPPKDGIMSKRQRSQLIKQAKEIEKAKAAGIDPADIPAPTMKPKVMKRKESNAADGDDDDARDTTEKGDGTMSGDKKLAKPVRPPRTPSPEMRMEDYTEEQLQRPSANYVVLIHEAITSAPNGQMNLQQIYNYIEKKYPWYKFKTTTSGWQSSVRHNLGQHDAFMKGDKEGKGFNWRINPDVSIEKERRKRQVSPPVNPARGQTYYPPNGYPPYGQPGYPPYHPGMPAHAMPQAAPRLPPSLVNSQPRLPPSMARDANATAPAAPQSAPRPSPYASPWAGGNAAGSPTAPNPPHPYPQPGAQPPSASAAPTPNGPYGVLYPTSAPPQHSTHSSASPYGSQYATTNASPYAQPPPRPYAPYAPPGQQSTGPHSQYPAPYPAQQPYAPPNPISPDQFDLHPSGRYPRNCSPDLIRQLEAFRGVYLKTRIEEGEPTKVDNAIRAYVDQTVPEASLTDSEKALLRAIKSIEGIDKLRPVAVVVVQKSAPPATPATSTSAAELVAGAAANTVGESQMQLQGKRETPAAGAEPHRFTPRMTGQHSPSVEPLTPASGSPLNGARPLPDAGNKAA
ncbi:hypothetical protein P153DRAFT_352961 [Dothidotthia symphoricarpi CBS 119687]|uniref:Fork-head domain-containing protein n=1 Tax=Dothidotthia symphoricarpi CBS 119687 TaxID=1392245 RepID=A0A6A6ARX3_9PLEO|nr:uncharacterized protein P153DRAFT_352961 [Dothidotthia symphoricarpi CBS 119687]KAF2133694.1 hypothetical protein P153DRAFT_352961 [Dothidotthia symphoricarpi CBS 119687]